MRSKYLYIDILNKLNHEGVGFECEIIDLFDIKDAIKDKFGPIGLLEVMKENEHIVYEHYYNEDGFNLPYDATKMPLKSIMASITFPGMEYLMKHDLNIKTKNSLRNQAIFNLLSIIILVATLYISRQSVLKDEIVLNSLNKLELKDKNTQAEINTLKDSISILSKYTKEEVNTTLHKRP